MKINAYAPTSLLITTLARTYWGAMAGEENRGVRVILQAIASAATRSNLRRFDAAGTVYITAGQLAGISGYSEKWVRICLQRLEAVEIISWVRGMIVEGKPTTSLLRISKKAIVELIRWARPLKDKVEAERRQAFIDRFRKTIKRRRTPSRGAGGVKTNRLQGRTASGLRAHLSCSNHVEVSSSPSLSKDYQAPPFGVRSDGARQEDKEKKGDTDMVKPVGLAFITSERRNVVKLPPRPEHDPLKLPSRCEHSFGKAPSTCLFCIEQATPKYALEQWRQRVQRLSGNYTEPSDDEIIEEKIAELAVKQATAEGHTMAGLALRTRAIAAQLRERYRKEKDPGFLW